MSNSEILEFDDVFSNLVVSPNIADLNNTFIQALDVSDASLSVVAFDIKCFTQPYTTSEDPNGINLYTQVVAHGIVPFILSWMPNTPENVESEKAHLASLGIIEPILQLRNVELCDIPKKNLSWIPDITSYTRSRITSDPDYAHHKIVMYIGRTWVDVLPITPTTSHPTVTANFHMLCYHGETDTWCYRMSPSKKVTV